MNAEKTNQLIEEPAPESAIMKKTRAGQAPPRTARDIAVGTVLGDKYRVERCLGEGAMGIVFAARHLGLDEMVAIKLVRPDVQDSDAALSRFAREAKLAARIHSEHVARVFDVGVLEPHGPFIVMEYLEGSSLAELLEVEGPLAASRLVGYLLQACEALAAAHAVGVVHRDVKPDNLFVTRRAGIEVVRLLDFGIAQVLPNAPAAPVGPASASSGVLGTPLYMAPEQLRAGSVVDARADIWALGVVAYELLSGAMPFGGASLPEICAAILEAEPAPLGAACPPALAELVLRCLSKDPARRFDSAAELASALLPLAPRDAHAYASRTSSILRASSVMRGAALLPLAATAASGGLPPLDAPPLDAPPLDATPLATPPLATPRQPARPAPETQKAVRFQSSALVASATILALAALGVVAALSRGSVATGEAEPLRPSASAMAAPIGVGLDGHERAPGAPLPAAPSAAEPPTTGDPPRALVSELPTAGELSSPVAAAWSAGRATAGGDAPPASREPPPAKPPRPTAGRAPQRATTASQRGARRAHPRVRLVEPRTRPRLVEREPSTRAEGSR